MTKQTSPLEGAADGADDERDSAHAAERDRNDAPPAPGSAWPDEIPW